MSYLIRYIMEVKGDWYIMHEQVLCKLCFNQLTTRVLPEIQVDVMWNYVHIRKCGFLWPNMGLLFLSLILSRQDVCFHLLLLAVCYYELVGYSGHTMIYFCIRNNEKCEMYNHSPSETCSIHREIITDEVRSV